MVHTFFYETENIVIIFCFDDKQAPNRMSAGSIAPCAVNHRGGIYESLSDINWN